MVDNISLDTVKQPNSEHDQYDLKKELKAMDDFIERLEVSRRGVVQRGTYFTPKRDFWDEMIDINCTPQGQDLRIRYSGTWGSLMEIWQLVGAYLSDAMSYEQKRT